MYKKPIVEIHRTSEEHSTEGCLRAGYVQFINVNNTNRRCSHSYIYGTFVFYSNSRGKCQIKLKAFGLFVRNLENIVLKFHLNGLRSKAPLIAISIPSPISFLFT